MRILVVEDEARLASAVERYLRENAFAVDVAKAGKDRGVYLQHPTWREHLTPPRRRYVPPRDSRAG